MGKREFDVEKQKLDNGDTGAKIPELIPGESNIFETDQEKINSQKYCRFKVNRNWSPANI